MEIKMNPDKRSEDASDDEASGRRAFLDSGVRAQIVEMIRDTNGPSYDNDLPNAAAAPTKQLDDNANHDNTELDNDQQSDCNGMEDGTGYEGFAKFLRKNQCCDAPENNLEEFPQLPENREIIIEKKDVPPPRRKSYGRRRLARDDRHRRYQSARNAFDCIRLDNTLCRSNTEGEVVETPLIGAPISTLVTNTAVVETPLATNPDIVENSLVTKTSVLETPAVLATVIEESTSVVIPTDSTFTGSPLMMAPAVEELDPTASAIIESPSIITSVNEEPTSVIAPMDVEPSLAIIEQPSSVEEPTSPLLIIEQPPLIKPIGVQSAVNNEVTSSSMEYSGKVEEPQTVNKPVTRRRWRPPPTYERNVAMTSILRLIAAKKQSAKSEPLDNNNCDSSCHCCSKTNTDSVTEQLLMKAEKENINPKCNFETIDSKDDIRFPTIRYRRGYKQQNLSASFKTGFQSNDALSCSSRSSASGSPPSNNVKPYTSINEQQGMCSVEAWLHKGTYDYNTGNNEAEANAERTYLSTEATIKFLTCDDYFEYEEYKEEEHQED